MLRIDRKGGVDFYLHFYNKFISCITIREQMRVTYYDKTVCPNGTNSNRAGYLYI